MVRGGFRGYIDSVFLGDPDQLHAFLGRNVAGVVVNASSLGQNQVSGQLGRFTDPQNAWQAEFFCLLAGIHHPVMIKGVVLDVLTDGQIYLGSFLHSFIHSAGLLDAVAVIAKGKSSRIFQGCHVDYLITGQVFSNSPILLEVDAAVGFV